MNDILIISGPSGSGKSTLVARLLKEYPGIRFSVSHTTRPPREGETDGTDYHFTDKTRFLEMIHRQEFIEWAEVHNNLYGTTLEEVERCTSDGSKVILDIDVQGVKNLKHKLQEALYIFILPPSIEELKRRLSNRNSESASSMNLRLKIALEEIKKIDYYDFVIINDEVDSAYRSLKSIIIANNHRVHYNMDKIRELFEIE